MRKSARSTRETQGVSARLRCLTALLVIGCFVIIPACDPADDAYQTLDEFWPPMPAAAPANPSAEDLASLRVESCASCHAEQAEPWHLARHAHAMEPGTLYQLLDQDGERQIAAEAVAGEGKCLTCHAPLKEQRPHQFVSRGGLLEVIPTAAFDQALSLSGISCSVCHVREGRIYGSRTLSADDDRHAVFGRDFFKEAGFCASCHEHPKATLYGPVGVEVYRTRTFNSPTTPVLRKHQSTYSDYLTSQAAAAGLTCQSCHMPGGQHQFRGIHHQEMVSQAVDLDLVQDGDALRVTLTNRTGHTFPVYRPPRVTLKIKYGEKNGSDTFRLDWTNFGPSASSLDNRLDVDEVRTYVLAIPENIRSVEAWIEVDPDSAYRDQHQAALVAGIRDGASPLRMEMIRKAMQDTSGTMFTIQRTRLALQPRTTESP